jgi:hypothetical protein
MILDRARALAETFEPIELDELVEAASLQTRIDCKYVVTWAAFEQLARDLATSHVMLDIAGDRLFTYDTVYFDTRALQTYRDHVQRRRKRFKCRSRRYVETDRYVFEVKLKGLRGSTVKRALVYDRAAHGSVDAQARAFMNDCLLEEYGHALTEELVPTLRTTYRRMTFARRDRSERLTCDFHFAANDLPFDPWRRSPGMLLGDRVIVEHKSTRDIGATRAALRALGAHPASCSKYCLGIALTHPEVADNDFRGLLRRHFLAGPDARLSGGEQAAAA